MTNKRTWLVLGATSMVGRAFAREAAEAGNDIILLGKEVDDLKLAALDLQARSPDVEVSFMEMDPVNVDSFGDIIAKCEETTQNIISVFSALETAYTQKECGKDLGKIKNMFQINYFSQVYFLTAASALLQKQGCGEIVVLGSTAGEFGMPDNYAYGSTKAALHVWLQGFYEQMASQGIYVTTIKVDDYDTVGGDRRYLLYHHSPDPKECAKACLKYAGTKVKVRYFPWYGFFSVLRRRFFPALVRPLNK